jgi:hypothetical protein
MSILLTLSASLSLVALGFWLGCVCCQRAAYSWELAARQMEARRLVLEAEKEGLLRINQELRTERAALQQLIRMRDETLQLTAPRPQHEAWEPNQN